VTFIDISVYDMLYVVSFANSFASVVSQNGLCYTDDKEQVLDPNTKIEQCRKWLD
jgi:hypothetical protein